MSLPLVGAGSSAAFTADVSLFNNRHEAGDFSEYDGTTLDGGDLSVAAPAALKGSSYGLQFLVDGTDLMRAFENNEIQTSDLRIRLYFDPNTLTMASGDTFNLMWSNQNGGSYRTLFSIQLNHDGSTYRLILSGNTDLNDFATSDNAIITDTEHYFEFYMHRAATAGSGDGTVQWWIDGILAGEFSGIDNYNLMADQRWNFQIGAQNLDVGTLGTFFLDEFAANTTGNKIGA